MRKLLCCVVIAAAVAPCSAFAWPIETTSYQLSIELSPDDRELHGAETVRWVNRTDTPTKELWFHLYLNAFASRETTFARERGDVRWQPDDLGWIRIDSLSWRGNALPGGLECRQPDDDNPADCTVARLVLPTTVGPGAAIEVDLEFSARLPTPIARNGAVDGFVFAGQFFPKLGVYEGADGWSCHQYHATSEFYADFGSYELNVAAPPGWLVVASGVPTAEPEVAGTGLWSFRAEHVHDVAFAAALESRWELVDTWFGPEHVPEVWRQRAVDRLGVSSADLALPSTAIRLLIPCQYSVLVPRLESATRRALAWLGLYFGPYPYPQLTVVAPPLNATEVGGMEYPTLVTTRATRLQATPPLSWSCALEAVTVHEVAHQYFYGVVASNETEHPWLDEGLTSFVEGRCLQDLTADGLLRCPLMLDPWAAQRVSLSSARGRLKPQRPGWEALDDRHAVLEAYGMPMLAMRSLEGLIGSDALLRGLRRYVADNRWRHGSMTSLRAALASETDADLEWLFEGVLAQGALPDWSVVDVLRAPSGEGWTVVIDRIGELCAPVIVEVEREDGTVERWTWDSCEADVRRPIAPGADLVRVELDPDQLWLLETSRRDNVWPQGTERAERGRWWMERLIRWTAGLVLPWS